MNFCEFQSDSIQYFLGMAHISSHLIHTVSFWMLALSKTIEHHGPGGSGRPGGSGLNMEVASVERLWRMVWTQ